nr:unnamed protein product [Digitaria exilis]
MGTDGPPGLFSPSGLYTHRLCPNRPTRAMRPMVGSKTICNTPSPKVAPPNPSHPAYTFVLASSGRSGARQGHCSRPEELRV